MAIFWYAGLSFRATAEQVRTAEEAVTAILESRSWKDGVMLSMGGRLFSITPGVPMIFDYSPEGSDERALIQTDGPSA